MPRWIIAMVCCAFATAARADEKPKPNTLTPKEIEEGWVLLFDGETTFGWKIEGEVKVANGALCLGSAKASSITSAAIFGSYELRLEYLLKGKASYTVADAAMSFADDREFIGVAVEMSIHVESKLINGTMHRKIQKGPIGISRGFGSSMAEGSGTAVPYPPASIRFDAAADSALTISTIRLKPLGSQSLFNAKDLAGWKVFDDPKRNKSQWTVTKEGWLNVKNGPGDLQTEKKFDDFILQFDCISNGKALNSGVFFRCIANEYQNGYEAQIQNGFKDNDRTKPTDFGTGAIYRRVASRKVVPNDNEWFTMTVLAHGKHFATWVNGYQTVDWTDERKDNDNPRNGYRAAAGHLSIQGHDPTTDLSFRNIRIVELKK